jgi:hypothetical protein
MKRPRRIVGFLLVAVLVLAALAVLLVDHTSKDNTVPTITTHVDGLDADKTPDSTIVVPKKTVEITALKLESNLQVPPPGTPKSQLDAVSKAANKIRATQAPLPTAGATSGFAGCRTSFVRNQSSRRGVRPQVQADHYTVSPNVPGWSDINAVLTRFDQNSSQVSSNFIIDAEGHCAYIVPIEAKAWTQAAGNPPTISYEIIATGREHIYLPPAGMRKLAAVQKEVSRRTGIPMRRGAIHNCVPTRSGIVQHKDYGICGGGHVDVSPFNFNQIIAQTIALAGVKPITAQDKITCRKINYWRHHGRVHGRSQQLASSRKAALHKRHVTCTTHGPVR